MALIDLVGAIGGDKPRRARSPRAPRIAGRRTGGKANRYTPHQGALECTKRRQRMGCKQ